MRTLLFLTGILLISLNLQAKRSAAKQIKPLVKNGTQYEVETKNVTCPNGNSVCGQQVILISKAPSGDRIYWQRELYQKEFNPEMESDTQAILPTSLKWNRKGQLVLVDERGTNYKVNPTTGEMIQPLKPILYPRPH